MKEELGGNAFVVATGGFANTMAAESDSIDVVEPFLTLDGLRILHEKILIQRPAVWRVLFL